MSTINPELQELLGDYLVEAGERLDRIELTLLSTRELAVEGRLDALNIIRRELHTLKGNSGMMGFRDLQDLAHELEDLVESIDPAEPSLDEVLPRVDGFRRMLEALRGDASAGEETTASMQRSERKEGSTRVALATLDSLHSATTELVVARHALGDRLDSCAALDPDHPDFNDQRKEAWREIEEARRTLEQILDRVQEEIQELRMVPLQSLFDRLQRLVHDEAAKYEKRIHFETVGGETPLDTALTEVATETLGHLVRNAIVHGIEDTQGRRAARKPEEGTIYIQASIKQGNVVIEVFDDGAGVNEPALRKAAATAGIPDADKAEIHTLLFHPGLSTRDSADQSAGRGIGLDVVLGAVHRHGGTIEIESGAGLGSCFSLRLPLTVAVTDALLVVSGGEQFAMPIQAIRETGFHTGRKADRESDAVSPLDLRRILNLETDGNDPEFFVTVEAEGRRRRLLVDALGDLRQVVINPLDEILGRPRGISGSTVLGNGDVVFILDPQQLTTARAEPSPNPS